MVPCDEQVVAVFRPFASDQATVNGRPVPVRCANFVFRAVQVQQGENRIRFTYATGLYTALALASWVLLGAVAAVSCWRWRRARTAG